MLPGEVEELAYRKALSEGIRLGAETATELSRLMERGDAGGAERSEAGEGRRYESMHDL